MLPDVYSDQFQQIMTLKLAKLSKEAADEYAKASADPARRGHLTSSSTAVLHNKVDIHLVERTISTVMELQRVLISSLEIPFGDTLATALKDQVKAHVAPNWCEGLHRRNSRGISAQHAARLKEELFVNREFFLKRAEAQIDFFVDTLRTKQR